MNIKHSISSFLLCTPKWLLVFISLIGFTVFQACEYNPYSQGQTLYEFHCANCHMADGSGLRGLIPPLANADYLKENQDQLACILKYGLKGEILVNGTPYTTEMVGITSLNDIQINNIINYINNSWGNNYGDSNVRDVQKALEQCNP